MNTLQCIALDDEQHALDILQAYIDKVPFLNLQHAGTDPWEVSDLLKSQGADILFLDIQMEGLSGLQFLESMRPDCAVIITSAYPEFAVMGFEYQVEDYLLKPFSFERFIKAVEKVRSSSRSASSPSEKIQESAAGIFVKGDGKGHLHRVLFRDIMYVESHRNYVQFICKDQKVITLMTMKDLEGQLPDSHFQRIHRSYIIRLDQVESVQGNSVRVNGQMLPIGKSYRKEFLGRLDKL